MQCLHYPCLLTTTVSPGELTILSAIPHSDSAFSCYIPAQHHLLLMDYLPHHPMAKTQPLTSTTSH